MQGNRGVGIRYPGYFNGQRRRVDRRTERDLTRSRPENTVESDQRLTLETKAGVEIGLNRRVTAVVRIRTKIAGGAKCDSEKSITSQKFAFAIKNR